MSKFSRFLVMIGLCFGYASSAQAGYLYSISGLNSTYAAGSSGTFDIVFSVTAGSTDPLNSVGGYTANFQTNGGAASTGLTFTAVNYVAPGPGANVSNTNFITSINGAGTRFSASNAGSPTFSLTNGDVLARVSFSLSGTASGTYVINSRSISSLTLGNGNTPSGFAPVDAAAGSFTISAVPEPSSMVLMGLVVAGGAGLRRRFRKKCTV